MKKFLAIFLSVLCIFSVFAVSASASIIEDISDIMDDADPLIYCVIYKSKTFSTVNMMYVPNPSMSFDGPGWVTVTKDTPIAIDYDFVCWQDKEGNLYFEGDKVYCNGETELYPVWEKKTDHDSHLVRVIKAGLASLQRIFQKLLGVFKDFNDFDRDWNAGNFEHTTTEPLIKETTTVPLED